MTKPIKPSEIVAHTPDFVLDAFNELISESYSIDSASAVVKQDDVIQRILAKIPDSSPVKRDQIFEKGWLNVESAYRKAGWKVEYEKPDRDESFAAFFRFTKK